MTEEVERIESFADALICRIRQWTSQTTELALRTQTSAEEEFAAASLYALEAAARRDTALRSAVRSAVEQHHLTDVDVDALIEALHIRSAHAKTASTLVPVDTAPPPVKCEAVASEPDCAAPAIPKAAIAPAKREEDGSPARKARRAASPPATPPAAPASAAVCDRCRGAVQTPRRCGPAVGELCDGYECESIICNQCQPPGCGFTWYCRRHSFGCSVCDAALPGDGFEAVRAHALLDSHRHALSRQTAEEMGKRWLRVGTRGPVEVFLGPDDVAAASRVYSSHDDASPSGPIPGAVGCWGSGNLVDQMVVRADGSVRWLQSGRVHRCRQLEWLEQGHRLIAGVSVYEVDVRWPVSSGGGASAPRIAEYLCRSIRGDTRWSTERPFRRIAASRLAA
eukprot:TRINITY_DN6444_c0_g1_i1.p1 TRINITY_DN6444_c0_g1~~TRINITY_DN6444_c0_g1_i1.p1  ORF type:complete len:396 (-),score=46.54 TRINITY_DN6444_c0_g1_i1:148-1335(-)